MDMAFYKTYSQDSLLHILNIPRGGSLNQSQVTLQNFYFCCCISINIHTIADPAVIELVKSKSKMAAWMVSHCNMHSGRDQLTKRLQEFIEVDIYGQCGTLECPHSIGSQCMEMLKSKYWFYLAFENSLCVDYITEKTFSYMRNYLIPVIFSGANLTRFLKYLSENPKAYADYFWWMKYYTHVGNDRSYCNLCRKLNEWDVDHRRQKYLDIQSWYAGDKCKERNVDFN
jgi:alpha-1,3-fucosyltransferase